MSGSDDDWFDKDIDELVDEVKKKTLLQAPIDTLNNDLGPPSTKTFFQDQDYGGSYDCTTKVDNLKKASGSKLSAKKGEKFIQRLSGKKLVFISEQEPLDAFLEVYQQDAGFFETFEETVPNDYIRPMLTVVAKICELPFQEYGRDFLSKFINSKSMLNQFSDFFTVLNANEDEIRKFVNVCWKIECFGLRNELLLDLLQKIKLKYESNFGLKTDLQRILDALGDDYKTHKEIYPSLDDLKKNDLVEVKPNITKGKYASIQEYINTHLSLLREDFVAPLRDFVSKLQKFESIEELPSKHIYKHTRFLLDGEFKSKTPKSMSFLVDLNARERETEKVNRNGNKKLPWVNPKKLMYGTLLCFTSGLEFTDMVLAVVSHREVEMLSNGYVYVEVLKMYNIANIFNREFLMFESEVYFEPYHHVYRVLRGLREQNFPMKNFIVNVEPNVSPPEYLKGSLKYNYKYLNCYFDPLNLSTYPPREVMGLDQSQLRAFENALSRKFSLIQGPPGTGKTFIGLKIVSTLLENVDGRILIACYTNHALDQFLAGVLETTTDIVRLGNQSKHELLDEYNIKQITEGAVKSRNLNVCFYNAKMEYSKLLEDFERLQSRRENGEEKKENIVEAQKKLRQASAKLDELKQIFEFKLVKNKKVIGMTTTYAARSNLLLQLLKIPIVVIEEAAEVLEPHVVATLTQSTEHVILIGDHHQLRPTTSVYRLSEKFKMDISLFERMINNNLNCVCLNTQHRMRPEVADLLRPTIYNDLRDAEDVRTYDNVRGVAKNMFFVNHDSKELKTSDESSKRNLHEVGFLLALADYLITQNYEPKDIVILSTYNGQMFEFFHERKNYPNLEKVRITVVDNFQGEESKIILLSLVRNNNENRIGYLAMKNRICVALSRAQEGFYVCGAIGFLANHNSTWQKVKETLERQGSIGNALPIVCPKHGRVIQVRCTEDFELIKSGKCCNKYL